MSLFSTLNTATSGLGVSGTYLSVIGDNIANINTTAYKAGRASFADFMPQDVMGLAGPSSVGMGAATHTISSMFGQGAIQGSDNALDMAISGSGFFVVGDGTADYYTRSGEFYMDDAGNVVTAGGLNLQGYNADNGTLGATVGDLNIDAGPISPSGTTEVNISAVLSTEADDTDTPFADGTYDLQSGTDDLATIADEAHYANSMTVYDSLGAAHEVTVVWERTSSNEWSWYALADAGEVFDTSGTAMGDEGNAWEIAQGTVTFDTDGELDAGTPPTITQRSASDAWTFEGASSQDIGFSLGMDAAGDDADGRLRMLSGDSAISAVSQDGYSSGDLSSLEVSDDGTVYGSYSNGEELILGQVVLANFPSTAGLERLGSGLYQASQGAGDPAIGSPGTGGRGSLVGSATEKSNVDLEKEFIAMITAQRSYQANARVINTTDDTLQELVQLV